MATIPLYNDGQMPGVREARGLSLVPEARYRVDYAGLAEAAARAYEQPLMPKDIFDGKGKVEAAEAWAGAVENVGGLVSDLAKKVGQVRDAGAMADGEKLMRDSFAEYQGGLDPLSDVASRVGGWQKQSQAVAKQILGSGRLSSRASEAMQGRMERFNADAVIHLSADASKQAVSQARGSFDALEQSALAQGDYDGALTANQGRTDAELQSPEEGAAREMQLLALRNEAEVDDLIEQDPVTVIEQLKALPRSVPRDAKLKKAEASLVHRQLESADDIKRGMQEKRLVTAGQIERYRRVLGDELLEKFAGNMAGMRDINDPVKYESAMAQLSDYDASDDADGAKASRLLLEISPDFDGDMEGSLREALEMHAKRTARRGANTIDAMFSSSMKSLQHALVSGVFGGWEYPASSISQGPDGKGWVRQRLEDEEPGEPVPIELSVEDELRMAGPVSPGNDVYVSDMHAKGRAAREAALIRRSMSTRYHSDGYAKAGEISADYTEHMSPHALRPLMKVLRQVPWWS